MNSQLKFWKVAQVFLFLIGIFILFNLIFFPKIGIHMFWNILIPVAPLLLVFGTGVWRNICPLAFTSMFPHRNGLSKRKKLSFKQSGILGLMAVLLLYVIVPLRHVTFNLNGTATAILIILTAVLAVLVGTRYEWKSAWCSGLCPISPVEKMYGATSVLSIKNAHCSNCHRCVTPCPDSTPGISPMSVSKTVYHKISGLLMVGGFPGFIYGWFQIRDLAGLTHLSQLTTIYSQPIFWMVASIVVFLILRKLFDPRIPVAIYSALSVSLYYWFRLPGLVGFGVFPGDGMLIDLSQHIPVWGGRTATLALSILFFYWIVFRKRTKQSWLVRPAYFQNDISLQAP